MPPLRQTVLTIHGVNPDREWQKRTARVMYPHFQPVNIEYDDYLTIKGPIKAVINLWVGLLVVVGLPAAAILLWHRSWMEVAVASIVIVGLILVGLWVAYRQRQACLRRVKPDLFQASRGDPLAPHVVAHSFGTYLVGSALSQFDDVRFDRVVLVGCVLPRRYPWAVVSKGKPDAVTSVRNETGKRDIVVKLVGAVKWLVRDLGNAGVKGFVGADVMHNETGSWGPCAVCSDTGETALVHNVPLEKYFHSDCFLGADHARLLWLPFLWGYTPKELDEYLKLCRNAAYLRQERDWTGLARVRRKLRRYVATWTRDKSLQKHLEREIECYLPHSQAAARIRRADRDVAAIADDALGHLYTVVIEALQEQDKDGARDDEVIRRIHPERAITRAVELALGVSP